MHRVIVIAFYGDDADISLSGHMKRQIYNCSILAIICLGLVICLFGTSDYFFPQSYFSPSSRESLIDFEGQFPECAVILFILIVLGLFDSHGFKHRTIRFRENPGRLLWQWIFLLFASITIAWQHPVIAFGINPSSDN
jgi:hypothetical protein